MAQLDQEEGYTVTDIEKALNQIEYDDKNRLFFVVFGVSWFLPALKSCVQVLRICRRLGPKLTML